MNDAHEPPVLLYDGVCGFCNSAVQFIIANDEKGTLRFAPLQNDYGQAVIERHPFLRGVDSVVFVRPGADPADERVYVRSRAALEVASYLGGAWRLLGVFRIVPAPLRDVLYDLFARYRYRFFGKHDSCMIPSRDVRSRFIGEF